MSAAIVAQAKRELEAAGADLSGPCGAFKIANLSAQKQGLGILSKPNGNNCQGYATDINMARDGRAWDMLIDGGGANTPAWNPIDPVDASLYREPIGTAPQPPDPPDPPTPQPPPVDLTPVLKKLDEMTQTAAQYDANNERRYLDIIAHIDHLVPASYEGSARVPFIGTAPITLTPVKK